MRRRIRRFIRRQLPVLLIVLAALGVIGFGAAKALEWAGEIVRAR